MTSPDFDAVQAQAIVGNARRLGLTWDMLRATVVSSDNPLAVSITVDEVTSTGTPILATSLIGRVFSGMRVSVIRVPPANHYIAGVVGAYDNDDRFVRTMGSRLDADATITATPTELSGTSVDFITHVPNAYLAVSIAVDVDCTVFGGTTLALARIGIDDTLYPELAILQVNTVNDRATVGQVYNIPIITPGPHRAYMAVSKSPNVGTILARITHTGWSGVLIDGP